MHPLYKYPTLYETKYPVIPVNGDFYIPGGYASNAPEIEIHHEHPFIHTEEDSDIFSPHHHPPGHHHYASAQPPYNQNTPPRPIFGLGYSSGYGYGQPILYGQPVSLHPYDYIGSDSTISVQAPAGQEKPWPNHSSSTNSTWGNQSYSAGNSNGFPRPTQVTADSHNLNPSTDLMNFNEKPNESTANAQFSGYNGDRRITTYFNPDDYIQLLNNKRKSN